MYICMEPTRLRWNGPYWGQIRRNSSHITLAYGRFLFTAHSDSKIRVWNVSETDKYFKPKKAITLPQKRTIFMYPRKKNINQHKDSISCIAYDVADKLLICTRVLGSWDKTVTVWKVSDKICVDSFLAHKGQVNTAIAINQQDGCACSLAPLIPQSKYGEGFFSQCYPSPIN